MEDVDFSAYDHALDLPNQAVGGTQGANIDPDDEEMEGDEIVDPIAYGYFAHDHCKVL